MTVATPSDERVEPLADVTRQIVGETVRRYRSVGIAALLALAVVTIAPTRSPEVVPFASDFGRPAADFERPEAPSPAVTAPSSGDADLDPPAGAPALPPVASIPPSDAPPSPPTSTPTTSTTTTTTSTTTTTAPPSDPEPSPTDLVCQLFGLGC